MIDNILPPKKSKPNLSEAPENTEQNLPGVQQDNPVEDGLNQQESDSPIILDEDGKLVEDRMKTKKKKFRLKGGLPDWRGWSRKRKIITATIISLFLIGIGVDLYWIFFHSDVEPSISITSNPKTTVASPLTGIQVSPELAKRPVTGIMIENSIYARPQSGIQDAGVVFEAIAEGGITRFMTLYQEAQPQYVGPVRSLRPYYLDFSVPFGASIAHVGGSPDALKQVRNGLKDLDQFFNADSYWRQSTRDAPHNVYTSFIKLDALNKSKGYKSTKFTSFLRKNDAKLTTPTARSIDFAISSYDYNVHYDYSAKTNSYLRSEGGAPHTATNSAAKKTGKQLHPKVVIALIMDYGFMTDGQHSNYTVTGSGRMYVFQDGGVTIGTWSKTNRASQFKFTDANNKPIKLDAGQTWFTALGAKNMVSYKP